MYMYERYKCITKMICNVHASNRLHVPSWYSYFDSCLVILHMYFHICLLRPICWNLVSDSIVDKEDIEFEGYKNSNGYVKIVYKHKNIWNDSIVYLSFKILCRNQTKLLFPWLPFVISFNLMPVNPTLPRYN